ncbi:MAG: hypothetical protein PUF72_10110 [Clostridiales bacterium]|nr:hypothetical protein [Clostridiales bacterium]
MKKKILSIAIGAAMLFTANITGTAAANDSWRDAFVTRIMKQMSTDPSYNRVALTDLDKNGIPEAFIYRDGLDGGISAGFTMTGNTITSIDVPSNIIGECLADIDVYIKNGNYIFVGKEVPRYSSVIAYYKLVLTGNTLEAVKISKSDVSPYESVQYVDMVGKNFLTDGYPNRTKISAFIDSYEKVNTLTAEPSTAKLSVNGNIYDLTGYNVNYANYYKIRDIAMLLRATSAKFEVAWNENGISLLPGSKYTVVGNELSPDYSNSLDISEYSGIIYVNDAPTDFAAYTINESTYMQIRDIASIAGFNVDWDGATQTIIITTN